MSKNFIDIIKKKQLEITKMKEVYKKVNESDESLLKRYKHHILNLHQLNSRMAYDMSNMKAKDIETIINLYDNVVQNLLENFIFNDICNCDMINLSQNLEKIYNPTLKKSTKNLHPIETYNPSFSLNPRKTYPPTPPTTK